MFSLDHHFSSAFSRLPSYGLCLRRCSCYGQTERSHLAAVLGSLSPFFSEAGLWRRARCAEGGQLGSQCASEP